MCPRPSDRDVFLQMGTNCGTVAKEEARSTNAALRGMDVAGSGFVVTKVS